MTHGWFLPYWQRRGTRQGGTDGGFLWFGRFLTDLVLASEDDLVAGLDVSPACKARGDDVCDGLRTFHIDDFHLANGLAAADDDHDLVGCGTLAVADAQHAEAPAGVDREHATGQAFLHHIFP